MYPSKWSFLFGACFALMAANGQSISRSVVDTSHYAILSYDSSVDMAMDVKFDRVKATMLSVAEVNEMEPLVDSSYREYNRKNPRRSLFGPLSAYRRQYVAVINKKGEKEVWINFFCSSFGCNWKHELLIVDDGGVCFFQLRLNISNGQAGELIPNGAA